MAKPFDIAIPEEGKKLESAQAKALRRRIADGLLTDEDQRRIRDTQAVIDGRAAGKSLTQIAAELGYPQSSFSQFVRGSIYTVWHEHLTELDREEDGSAASETVKQVRTTLAHMTPHIVELLKHATRKDGEDRFVDEGAAQWAAEYLTKNTAVGQQESVQRPAIHIHVDTINAVSGDIRKDTNAALRAAGAVIDGICEAVVETPLGMDNGA